MPGHRVGQPWRRGSPGLRQRARGLFDVTERVAARRVELGGARVVLLELIEASARLARIFDDVAQRGAVLAFELGELRSTVLSILQALRVGDDRLLGRPHVVGRFLDVALEQPEPFGERGERRAPRQRRDRGAERVFARAFELSVRARQCLPMRLGVGKQLHFGEEPVIFGSVDNRGRVDLFDLVPEQIDLTSARALVAPER